MRVLVQGIGDVGSAVAHAVFAEGMSVVMVDRPLPAHSRRGMAFTDALFEGKAALAGVWCKRSAPGAHARAMLACGKAIAALDCSLEAALGIARFDVLVDARMRKRATPDRQVGLVPLTIGLGPNFSAGDGVDLAVETQWGDRLGALIAHGATAPFGGEPKPIAGHARDRYVYAPAGGLFLTDRRIGDRVDPGEIVAWLGTTPLRAPLAGCLRGLTHHGAVVSPADKVIEIDPRAERERVFGIGERPGRIAQGVLAAIRGACAAPA